MPLKKGHKFTNRAHTPNPEGPRPKYGQKMSEWKSVNIPIPPELHQKLKDDELAIADRIRLVLMDYYKLPFDILTKASDN